MGKLLLNQTALNDDLENNWAVVAEAIQNILRRERFEQPYEALKTLTRGANHITEDNIKAFIDQLDISDIVKKELLEITPFNYIGYID